MMNDTYCETYSEFWPYYLREHIQGRRRGSLHFAGTGRCVVFSWRSWQSSRLNPWLVACSTSGRWLRSGLDRALLHRKEPAGDIHLSLVVAHQRFPDVLLLGHGANSVAELRKCWRRVRPSAVLIKACHRIPDLEDPVSWTCKSWFKEQCPRECRRRSTSDSRQQACRCRPATIVREQCEGAFDRCGYKDRTAASVTNGGSGGRRRRCGTLSIRQAPDHGILGEEHSRRWGSTATMCGFSIRSTAPGSSPAGLPNFGVLIALCHKGQPVVWASSSSR